MNDHRPEAPPRLRGAPNGAEPGRRRRPSPSQSPWPLWAATAVALVAWAALAGAGAGPRGAEAASGVELILGKSRPSPPPDAASAEGQEGADGGNSTSNSTKPALTGNPQVDYLQDPNLPRELQGYNLSAYPFYERVPDPEEMNFSCDGLHDGFYASVPHKCQVYHHCLFGTRYDFLCANYTAFDQKTFICHFVSEVDCENSPKYFNRNEALYKQTTTTTTTTPAPRQSSSRGKGRGGRRPARPRQPAYYREDDYEDYEEYEDYADEAPSKGPSRRGQGGAQTDPPLPAAPPRAVFERPRVLPKVRRPVPLSERDKYEYPGATPAASGAAPVTPAPSSAPPPPRDAETGRSNSDSDRDRGKTTSSREEEYGRRPEGGTSASRDRERDRTPTDTYSRDRDRESYRRPMESGYRHRDEYRGYRERSRDRRPYRRRPYEEEDDYYEDYEEEEDYRPRRRPRPRARPRRPPPRYRDEYEDEEYEDEEDAYARPVPASRPGYVTAPGSARSTRTRTRAPARRPSRYGSRYTDDDEYYYDEEEEPVDTRPRGTTMRRRGRPSATIAAVTPKRRYPEDEEDEEDLTGPSAPASAPAAAAAAAPTSRRPAPTSTRSTKSPSTTTTTTTTTTTPLPPPSTTSGAQGLRGKLVEVRRFPVRTAAQAPEGTDVPEPMRGSFRYESRVPQQVEQQEQRQRFEPRNRDPLPAQDGDSKQRFGSRDPDFEPRQRGPSDAGESGRSRYEPRAPSKSPSFEPRGSSQSRFPPPPQPLNRGPQSPPSPPPPPPLPPFAPEEEEEEEEEPAFAPRGPQSPFSQQKFPSRAEYESRPTKLPSRTLASDSRGETGPVKFSNGRPGPGTQPQEDITLEREEPRQRFEPRSPSKYSPRPTGTPPPPPPPTEQQQHKQQQQQQQRVQEESNDSVENPQGVAPEDSLPPTGPSGAAGPLAPAPTASSDRYSGTFLSRTPPSGPEAFAKFGSRQQSSSYPQDSNISLTKPAKPLKNADYYSAKYSGREPLSKSRPSPPPPQGRQPPPPPPPPSKAPLPLAPRVPEPPKFVPKYPVGATRGRSPFPRPDRLNLAEVDDELEEDDPEDPEDEEDEAINDALHPRPRPLRAEAATAVAPAAIAPPVPHSNAPQTLSPTGTGALGTLLRLTAASTAPRRLAARAPVPSQHLHAPQIATLRVRAQVQDPSSYRQVQVYDPYFTY